MTKDPPQTPFVVITPDTMYARLLQVHDVTQQTSSDVRTALDKIGDLQAGLSTKADAEKVASLTGQVDRHENRLDSLDRRLWIATGFAAAIGGTAVKLLPLIGG